MKRTSFRPMVWVALLLFAAACGPSAEEAATQPAAAWTATPTFTPSLTSTATDTPTPTNTPTPIDTPTPTSTPTEAPMTATANKNANCRWGPGTAYRGWGIILYEGEVAYPEGRNEGWDGEWYWVRMEDANRNCWVHASTVDLSGDPDTLPYLVANIPTNGDVPSPSGVSASRSGDQVIISWSAAPAAPELAYLIAGEICTNGYLIEAAFETESTSITLPDETTCSGTSFASVWTTNKLGYSEPVPVAPWP